MTYAESLWASRLSGLVMRWRFDRRVGWQGGSVFERMERITRLPRWPPVLSATPSEKDPNRPLLSRGSECVTDRLANWERCPVRNFSRRECERYQRPVGSLGCNIHHKAECLCWGCSICVFRAAGGKRGTCLLCCSLCVITRLICLCVHAFYPVFILLVCGICAFCWLWQGCVTYSSSVFILCSLMHCYLFTWKHSTDSESQWNTDVIYSGDR